MMKASGVALGVILLAAVGGAVFFFRAQGQPQNLFAGYMRQHPKLAADVAVKLQGYPLVGKGTFFSGGNQQYAFKLRWGPSDFTLVSLSSSTLEIEASTKRYLEFPFASDLSRGYTSGIQQAPGVGFPSALVVGDLEKMWLHPKDLKVSDGEDIGGQKTKHLTATRSSGQSSSKVEAFIAEDGRLLRYILTLPDRSGNDIVAQIDLSNYRSEVSPTAFSTEIPDGFVPDSLPYETPPIDVGTVFPDLAGTDPSGGSISLSKLLAEKASFVAAVAGDCEPSVRSAGSLAEIGKTLPVIILNTSGDPLPAGFGSFQTFGKLSEAQLAKIGVPSTPIYWLVGKDGRVKQVWVGFDAARSSAWIKEVADAVAKLEKPGS